MPLTTIAAEPATPEQCKILAQVCKTAAEGKVWGFNHTNFLARIWEPGTVYAVGVIVRPPTPNGYEYVSSGGQSGYRVPRFPTTGSVTDGSITWTPQVISNDSLRATIATSTWSCEDDEITFDGEAIESAEGQQIVSAIVLGGNEGQTYEVINLTVFTNGEKEESGIEVYITP